MNALYKSDVNNMPETGVPYMHGHAAVDLNGDGVVEIIASLTNFGEFVKNPLRIYSMAPDGSYVDMTSSFIEGAVPELYLGKTVLISDFNKDGKPDIFIADTGVDIPSQGPGAPNVLLLSSTSGKLVDSSSKMPTHNDFSHSAATGDIDGDGDIDIFVGNFTPMKNSFTQSYFLINDGTGTFTESIGFVPPALLDENGPVIGSSALVDVTGDGIVDLVVGVHAFFPNRVYIGNGTGNFSTSQYFELPSQILSGKIGNGIWVHPFDMDNNGLMDLAISYYGPNGDYTTSDPNAYHGSAIQILRNLGGNQFEDVSALFPLSQRDDGFAPSQWFVMVRSADLNGDGFQDLYATNLNTAGMPPRANSPVMWLSDGHGGYKVLDETYFPNERGYNGYPSPLEFIQGQDIFTLGGVGPEILRQVAPFSSIKFDLKSMTLAGTRANFIVDWLPDGRVSVQSGGDAAQKFVSIGRIDFTDGSLLFDLTSPNAAAAYRLYGGAFDRTPDEGGLRFWVTQWLDAGKSLHDVAVNFINLPEFGSLYGTNLSTAQFVDQLYQNVLGRAGDAGGVSFWNSYLDNGTGDRAAVLVNFTQLPEYVGNSAANINDGLWVV